MVKVYLNNEAVTTGEACRKLDLSQAGLFGRLVGKADKFSVGDDNSVIMYDAEDNPLWYVSADQSTDEITVDAKLALFAFANRDELSRD